MSLPIDFKSLSQKQKVLLLVCVAVIFLGAGMALTTSQSPKPVPSVSRFPLNPQLTPVPTLVPANFILVPATATIKKGEKLTLSLRLNSGQYSVDAADAVLSFDPKVFKVEKVTPGKLFGQYPVKRIDNKLGEVQLSGAGEIKEGAVSAFTGEDEYGTVVFTALASSSSTPVSFTGKSVCASKGQSCLDLSKSSGGTYVIK